MLTLNFCESKCRKESDEALEERFQRVIAAHFDPAWGSAYWLELAGKMGIDGLRQLRVPEDLSLLGGMCAEDLRHRPLLDYIPRRFHDQLHGLVVAQTGGTTAGGGTWTAYRNDEFAEAFVQPFIDAARPLGFPIGRQWLFVGPSGPHVIAKAVRHLAAAFNSPDPFAVDFDPRWAKKLPQGSFGRQRYVEHIVAQAMAVVETQDVGILFTTPPVLEALSSRMTASQRERIAAVHYGGLAITPAEMLRFQTECFPNALHLSGYGNTLFGCCMELSAAPGREIDYFPHGNRLIFEVIDAESSADGFGKIRFTRLDETMLIVGMAERDIAQGIMPPSNVPPGFTQAGLRNPHPPAAIETQIATGLY